MLLGPCLHIQERQAALKCDSWPNLCMALGWPLAGGHDTWPVGTRSEMWKSCHQRHTEVCEELRCIPCCTPYPGPPAGTEWGVRGWRGWWAQTTFTKWAVFSKPVNSAPQHLNLWQQVSLCWGFREKRAAGQLVSSSSRAGENAA